MLNAQAAHLLSSCGSENRGKQCRLATSLLQLTSLYPWVTVAGLVMKDLGIVLVLVVSPAQTPQLALPHLLSQLETARDLAETTS